MLVKWPDGVVGVCRLEWELRLEGEPGKELGWAGPGPRKPGDGLKLEPLDPGGRCQLGRCRAHRPAWRPEGIRS